ncbi:hypothetical protein F5Y16DRAFT_178602 [Xylariaceae sp. FL0255]|nr:hypothetical protein F5Y16DRAFT_178602 [Xylariaceae sp. FL0255]
MRLLHFQDGKISLTKEYIDNPPPYAIVSHTWDLNEENEVIFDDFQAGVPESKVGFSKIQFCAKQALADGLPYFWIDSCCINRHSSTELAYAINSMFRWYQKAVKCYALLADVIDRDDPQQMIQSRWFTRGWTLQELLAPASVDFFTAKGEHIGDKSSLEDRIKEITKIRPLALRGISLSSFTIEERKSWAKGRTTTREEDMAYSMLGIFGLYMPLIYGEGIQNASRRLDEEIDKSMGRHKALTVGPDYDAIANVLKPYIHESDTKMDPFNEAEFRKAAFTAFEHLDSSGFGYLTGNDLKVFYVKTLTRIETDAGGEEIMGWVNRDLSNDGLEHMDLDSFIALLRRFIDSVKPTHERYLWNQYVQHDERLTKKKPPDVVPTSWGWDKSWKNGIFTYVDTITGMRSKTCYPLAHQNSFGMMAARARQCIVTLNRLQSYFVAFGSNQVQNSYDTVFNGLQELAFNYIMEEQLGSEKRVDTLDDTIINFFISRNLAAPMDTPAAIIGVEALVRTLKPLWLEASVTFHKVLSITASLQDIQDFLDKNSWSKRDIPCLVAFAKKHAPDWNKLRDIRQQLTTSPHIPSLLKAAEDLAYNFALNIPMLMELKSIVVETKLLQRTSFIEKLKKRRLTLRVTLHDRGGHHDGFEIYKNWDEGRTSVPLNLFHEFHLNLNITLQPAFTIRIRVLDHDNLLEEQYVVA